MDEDFDRRRELRRQKREEMRLEAERISCQRNNEDEEEVARERRRRARQERLHNKDGEEAVAAVMESTGLNDSSSTAETDRTGGTGSSAPSEEDRALQERLAQREERRQRRLWEAQERQKELGVAPDAESSREEQPAGRRGRYGDAKEEPIDSAWGRKEEEEEEEEPEAEEKKEEEEVVEETSRFFKREEVMEVTPQPKQHNGGLHDDTPAKHKKPERTLSRGSVRSPDVDEADDVSCLEAERKLEELKRRRDNAEIEEFEKMRQKQQGAEAELEDLKRKREGRRKVLEEEEKQRKQEMEEKKVREEDEKKKMKEEIERRRAEAAEKRQKGEESVDGETAKPFKCVIPKGSSLKIGERAEFLNKSAQKSSAVKISHTPVISKIENRLEQYTTALQSHKEARSPRPAAMDLPSVTDGIRSIKSMWEKGNAFRSPGGHGNINKEATGMKFGVSARISDWLSKTPESTKPAGGMPADLKPGDVTNKRSLWENKGSSPKMTDGDQGKAVTNAGVGLQKT